MEELLLSSLLFLKSQPAKIPASQCPGSTATLQPQPGQTCLPISSSRTHLAPAAALPEVGLPGFGAGMEFLDVFLSQQQGRAGLTLTHSSEELPALHPTLTSLLILGVALATLQGCCGLGWRTASVTSCSGSCHLSRKQIPCGPVHRGDSSVPSLGVLLKPLPLTLPQPRTIGLRASPACSSGRAVHFP